MNAFLSSLLDFVSLHRDWAGWIVFVLAFAETLAFLSILIPSTVLLVGIGGLVAVGVLDFWPLFFGAAAGALMGSTVSYWLGLRYGTAMMRIWPLNRDPDMMERGRAAFARWGASAVLIGHFFGPLRSVAFAGAGFAAMPALVFQMANVPGSIAWAFLIPKSGELGGDAIGAIWRAMIGA